MIEVALACLMLSCMALCLYFMYTSSDVRAVLAASASAGLLAAAYALLGLTAMALIQLGVAVGIITVIMLASAGVGLERGYRPQAHAAVIALILSVPLLFMLPWLAGEVRAGSVLLDPSKDSLPYLLLLQALVLLAASISVRRLMGGGEE